MKNLKHIQDTDAISEKLKISMRIINDSKMRTRKYSWSLTHND